MTPEIEQDIKAGLDLNALIRKHNCDSFDMTIRQALFDHEKAQTELAASARATKAKDEQEQREAEQLAEFTESWRSVLTSGDFGSLTDCEENVRKDARDFPAVPLPKLQAEFKHLFDEIVGDKKLAKSSSRRTRRSATTPVFVGPGDERWFRSTDYPDWALSDCSRMGRFVDYGVEPVDFKKSVTNFGVLYYRLRIDGKQKALRYQYLFEHAKFGRKYNSNAVRKTKKGDDGAAKK